MFSGLPAQRQRTTLAELGSIMSSFPRPDKKLGVPRICDTPSGITLYASVSRFRARSSLRNVALEGLGNLLFRHRADDLLDDLAILENQERWNPANVVAACGIHGLINVELGHFQLSRVIVGNLRHRGREHVTRAAPLRPKIDHDRLSVARRQYFCFEISIVYCLNAIVSHVLYPQGLTEASPFSRQPVQLDVATGFWFLGAGAVSTTAGKPRAIRAAAYTLTYSTAEAFQEKSLAMPFN